MSWREHMKFYQTCFITLLTATSLMGCGSGSSDKAPVEVSTSQSPNQFSPKGYDNLIVVTSVADQVRVNKVIVNRGNGCNVFSWNGTTSMSYGQSIEGATHCEPNQIREVSVSTDQGDYTFNF